MTSDKSRQAVTPAGVFAAAVRQTEINYVGVSNQFRGSGLRAPTVCCHRLVGLSAFPHVDTPTAGTRKHDRGIPKMLNPM